MRRVRLLVLVCAGFVATLVATARVLSGPSGAGARRTVVVLVLDTTRLDEIGVYGGDPGTTPNLDRLASEGIRYSAAFATDSLTLSSHAALFSGRLTGTERELSTEAPTLPERMKKAGFRTIGVSANWVLDSGGGFDRGFDFFTNAVDPLTRSRVAAKKTVNAEGRRERAKASQVIAVLEEALKRDVRPADSLMVFLNFLDPHDPYTPEPKFKARWAGRVHVSGHLRAEDGSLSRFFARASKLAPRTRRELRRLYRAEVAQADAAVGTLRALMQELGRDEETLYVVTADHGELFGEKGCWTHNVGLSEEEVHVPLIVRGPGISRGAVEREPISLADLGAAIVGWGEGRPWKTEARPPLLYHHIYGVNDPTGDPFNRRDLVGFVEGDWRVTRSQSECRLYQRAEPYWQELPCDSATGPGSEMFGQLNAEFRIQIGLARLEDWVCKQPTAEWLQKLRSLGYLGN